MFEIVAIFFVSFIRVGASVFINGDWLDLTFVAFSCGSGAWMGCMVAMKFHRKVDT